VERQAICIDERVCDAEHEKPGEEGFGEIKF